MLADSYNGPQRIRNTEEIGPKKDFAVIPKALLQIRVPRLVFTPIFGKFAAKESPQNKLPNFISKVPVKSLGSHAGYLAGVPRGLSNRRMAAQQPLSLRFIPFSLRPPVIPPCRAQELFLLVLSLGKLSR